MYSQFDPKLKCDIMNIFAGEYYISKKQEVLSTVLGSCIAVCLYDSENSIGGMNHFMLPDSAAQSSGDSEKSFSGESGIRREKLSDKSMRYGITSMEILIAEMQKNGAQRKNLKAKIFGGGNVLVKSKKGEAIGDKNIGFTRAFLKMEKIPIVKEDVGGFNGRKVYFLTGNDSVFVRKVAMDQTVAAEREYMDKLKEIKNKSDVTLF